MNIMEYRAMKAQQAEQKDSTPKEQPNVQAEPTVTPNQTQTQEETKQDQGVPTDQGTTVGNGKVQEQTKDKVAIDGVGEVDIDELKNGYLRQQDYTKKTQELSRQRQEQQEALQFFEQVKRNPQLAQQLGEQADLPNSLDPISARFQELENKYYDLMLEKEIDSLTSKYPDFEVREVLNVAHQKGLTNLEDAYFLSKSSRLGTPAQQQSATPDVESLKEQIRAELLKEMASEQSATQSIISSNDSRMSAQDNAPQISQEEIEIARKFKLSPEEYIKWRDA